MAKKTLVIGGTGHLGRDLVARLQTEGRAFRVFARKPGTDSTIEWAPGDLATGAGLEDALRGIDSVIHAATNSPIARSGTVRLSDLRASPADVDIDGTRHLLNECVRAGVGHFVFVSIVGLDQSALPYAKVKLAGERLVRDAPLPWSVVRASVFYYLLERMLSGFHWFPVWPLPDAPINPVDTSDVAAYLAECLDDEKRGMREEIGGPATAGFVEFARQYQRSRGLHRPIMPIRVSSRRAGQLGLTAARGRSGAKTWAAWLNEHPADAHKVAA